MLCYKKSALVALFSGITFYGCSETTLTTCPVIINPLNTGQQIKLIPNQKVNEYAIALICSTNTPTIVGGSKRCLTQAEDGPYISSLFQTCSGAPRNVAGSTVLPVGGKGQQRPPIMGNTNVPPIIPQGFSSSTIQPGISTQSQPITPSAVPTASTTNPTASWIPTTEETTFTTEPEATTVGTEPTVPGPGRSGRRVTFDTTEIPTDEPSTEPTMTESTTEPSGFFDFSGGFF